VAEVLQPDKHTRTRTSAASTITSICALHCVLACRCDPNVKLMPLTGDRTATVVVTEPLPADGSELQLNYVDVAMPAAFRRADLKHYGFYCRCKRCAEDDEKAGGKTAAASASA